MAFPPFDSSALSFIHDQKSRHRLSCGKPGAGIFIWSNRRKSCSPKKQSCGDTAFVENGLLSGIVIRCGRSSSLLIVLWFRCSGSGICQRLPGVFHCILPTAIFRKGLEVCLPTYKTQQKRRPAFPWGKQSVFLLFCSPVHCEQITSPCSYGCREQCRSGQRRRQPAASSAGRGSSRQRSEERCCW
mgnify:CR=1 FL=1